MFSLGISGQLRRCDGVLATLYLHGSSSSYDL
jgi:hypothetical protein